MIFRPTGPMENPADWTASSEEKMKTETPQRACALEELERMRARRIARIAARGMSLLEIMIVIAIMSLIATGVGFAIVPRWQKAQVDTATTNARAIRNAAISWRATSGDDSCPTVSQLVADKMIDSASKTEDPWGSPYKIICTEDDITVTSSGPDKKDGTKDDIAVPNLPGS